MKSESSGHHQGGTGRDSAATHGANLGLAMLAELANWIAIVLNNIKMILLFAILYFPGLYGPVYEYITGYATIKHTMPLMPQG